jgi:hypothetical protein
VVDYRQIKSSSIDCYANKKDPNGQILQQQNCSHCQPWKFTHTSKPSKTDIKSLLQYFKQHSIKEIKLVNGELIITHNNNNETLSTQEVDNNQELQLAQDMAQKNSDRLTIAELEKMFNTNSHQSSTTPSNNNL